MRGCHCDNKTVYNLCEIINERRVTHSEQVSSVRVITAVPELGDGCGLVPALPDSAHFHWDLSPGHKREREREREAHIQGVIHCDIILASNNHRGLSWPLQIDQSTSHGQA